MKYVPSRVFFNCLARLCVSSSDNPLNTKQYLSADRWKSLPDAYLLENCICPLSQQAGLRIKGQMQFSSRYASGKLFHLSADRYCFVLRGLSLEETQSLARQLKNTLDGTYFIHPLSAAPGRPALPENMQEISGVTTHLGIQHYPFNYLAMVLQRYPANEAAKRARAVIVSNIEAALERGKTEGGNCIMTCDPEIWNYRSLD